MAINCYKVAKHIKLGDYIDIFLIDLRLNHESINMSIVPNDQIVACHWYQKKIDVERRLLSRSFLYELLASRYGASSYNLDFNTYKKPRLTSFNNLDFSFSYSKYYVLVGISLCGSLGIDIEHNNPALPITEVAPKIMSRAEMQYFKSFPDSSAQRNYFFNVFAAKESIIKAFGTGLYFSPKDLNTIGSNIFQYNGTTYKQYSFPELQNEYSLSVCFSI